MSKRPNELVIIQKITRNQNGIDFAVIRNTLLFNKQKSVIKQRDLRVKASKILFKNIYGYGYPIPFGEILDEKTIPSKIILENIDEYIILIFIYFNTHTKKISKAMDKLKNERCIGIDIGKKNTFAITNNLSKKPIIINGTMMQKLYYEDLYLFNKYLKNALSFLQNYINKNKIDTIYVGDMKKYEPYSTIVDSLFELKNVKVVLIDEENTSKASFLDSDICVSDKFTGKRINRSTYRSGNGTLIDADINASYNIILKGNQLAFSNCCYTHTKPEVFDISKL